MIKSVSRVEVINPPTTTVANGFWISDPVPLANSIGIKLKMAIDAVINTGRNLLRLPFLIASCLAIPLVYLLLNEWLTQYMNRTQIGLDVFLYALVVIAISFIVVSTIMTYKVLSKDPVNNLKYE